MLPFRGALKQFLEGTSLVQARITPLSVVSSSIIFVLFVPLLATLLPNSDKKSWISEAELLFLTSIGLSLRSRT